MRALRETKTKLQENKTKIFNWFLLEKLTYSVPFNVQNNIEVLQTLLTRCSDVCDKPPQKKSPAQRCHTHKKKYFNFRSTNLKRSGCSKMKFL